MTKDEIYFISQVELNRGVIKSVKHKDMLCDILGLGTKTIQDELTNAKHLGIKFYWDVVQKLNHTEQNDLIARFSRGRYSKVAAQIIFNDIVLKQTKGV